MARKQYTGAKVAILAAAAGAVMYGTAWLSVNAAPSDTSTTEPATNPVTSTSSTGSTAGTAGSTTTKPVQATAPRAKRSRGS